MGVLKSKYNYLKDRCQLNDIESKFYNRANMIRYLKIFIQQIAV